MLPPFVPPGARVSTESLPLITEFVIDRTEQSFGSSSASHGAEAGGVATLPSIDEFVRATPEHREMPEDFVQRTSRSPWGTYEAKHEVAGTPQPAPPVPARITLEPDMLLTGHHAPSGAEGAVVNEIAEPTDAWAASAAAGGSEPPPPEPAKASSEEVSKPPAAPLTVASEVWVAEERDAFDWKGVANLAVPPAEAQRAAEEWSATEWDRSSGSLQDHVAGLLSQVSRRVRSGELEVQGSKQMGPEAALVAALAAMLGESRAS